MSERGVDPRNADDPDDAALGRLIGAAGRGPTASPEAKARVYGAVRSAWEARMAAERARRQARSRRRRAAVLAAAIGVVAVTVFWFAPRDRTSAGIARLTRVEGMAEVASAGASHAVALGAHGAIETGDRLTTGSNGRAAFEVGDGIVLRVNADSELVFASTSRLEVHAGTVYLDTGGAAVRRMPLAVETPFGVVEHRGTQYEVHVGGAELRIRVREGRVAFADGSRETLGGAGEQLVISQSGAVARSAIAADDPAWSWATQLAALAPASEYRLTDLLAWIARETGRKLEYASPAVEQRAAAVDLHGLEGLTPEQALDAIRRTTSLRYDVAAGSLIVR